MYDIIIIGAGPGGYVAAERAGKAGKRVLLVEKEALGGVCLNSGCIPTKSLLHCAKAYKNISDSARFGVKADNLEFNLETAMRWKDSAVLTLQKGINFLMKKYNVEVVAGTGTIISPEKVAINGEVHETKNIIIATGSSASRPAISGIDLPHVMTNTGMVNIKTLPARVGIIGGGVVGIEYASFFSALGIETEVIEVLPEILPVMDREQATALRKAMKKTIFHLETKVDEITLHGIRYSDKNGTAEISCDLVLIAAGRTPNLLNLGLEAACIEFTPKGIPVNGRMMTNIEGVYAVGDVTGQCMLAHGASRMGEVCVNAICGIKDKIDFDAIPWAIYSIPEAAGCGWNEKQVVEKGLEPIVVSSAYRANGRFLAENGFGSEGATGTAKIVADKKTGIILGVHLLGPYASENIGAAAVIIKMKTTLAQMKEIVFPHPTLSEVMREAAFGI